LITFETTPEEREEPRPADKYSNINCVTIEIAEIFENQNALSPF
jgi:hypothetical protein